MQQSVLGCPEIVSAKTINPKFFNLASGICLEQKQKTATYIPKISQEWSLDYFFSTKSSWARLS